MIKIIMAMAKLAVLAVVIMLISQIPVGQKRICDHVQDVTLSKFIQGPVVWVAERFDFSDGKVHRRTAARADRGEAKRSARATGSARDMESDSETLSGLFKQR